MDKSPLNELAKSIEQSYESDFLQPFPLEDIQTLRAISPSKWEFFHSYVDLDASSIAGLCCRATRLHKRDAHLLEEARTHLAAPFFERHPELRVFETHITTEKTPRLSRLLLVMETRRQELLVLLAESASLK